MAMSNSTFCPIPWIHLSSHPNGDVRICCDMSDRAESSLMGENAQAINIKKTPTHAFRNHPLLKKMRQEMLAGVRPKACASCWKREDLSTPSRRQSLNQRFPSSYMRAKLFTKKDGEISDQKFPIRYFDLRLGNNCNLMCRSCGPVDSSLWMQDGLETRSLGESFEWNDDNQLIKDFKDGNFEHIDVIYFTGGEPFINRHHWKVLKLLIEQKQSSKIALEYNSNVTVLPADAEEVWSHFKFIHVTCSIDGIDRYVEYIRPPSRWHILDKNIAKLDQMDLPLSLELSPTISILNVAHIPDMILWAYHKKFKKFNRLIFNHILYNPEYLSIQTLPLQSKLLIKDKFERLWEKLTNMHEQKIVDELKPLFDSVIEFMMIENQSLKTLCFDAKIARLDQKFGQDFATHLPVVHQLVKGLRSSELEFEVFDPRGTIAP